MDTKTLQALTEKLWGDYAEIFPRLVRFDTPKIILNNRLRTCAGYNQSDENVVNLASKFFINNHKNMLINILPHELAHQIDFNLNGWKTGQLHHGKPWKNIMVKIGLEPLAYHTMVL